MAAAASGLPGELDAPYLPDELLFYIFGMLHPIDIKRLCLVMNHKFNEIVHRYMSTRRYAAWLARSMLTYCVASIISKHLKYRCRCGGALDAALGVERHIVATLTGRADLPFAGFKGRADLPLAGWKRVDYLRLLYPGATQLPYWPLATHALEWCARHERDILGVGGGPRREILALLRRNAILELGKLAGPMSGNDNVFRYRAVVLVGATSLMPNATVEGCIRAVVHESVRVDGCGVLAIAMAAAVYTYRRCRRSSVGYARVMHEELFKVQDSIWHLTLPASSEDWLDLAGYSEKRGLSELLSFYESDACSYDSDSGVDGDDDGADGDDDGADGDDDGADGDDDGADGADGADASD
jgi:hypothetical protein